MLIDNLNIDCLVIVKVPRSKIHYGKTQIGIRTDDKGELLSEIIQVYYQGEHLADLGIKDLNKQLKKYNNELAGVSIESRVKEAIIKGFIQVKSLNRMIENSGIDYVGELKEGIDLSVEALAEHGNYFQREAGEIDLNIRSIGSSQSPPKEVSPESLNSGGCQIPPLNKWTDRIRIICERIVKQIAIVYAKVRSGEYKNDFIKKINTAYNKVRAALAECIKRMHRYDVYKDRSMGRG